MRHPHNMINNNNYCHQNFELGSSGGSRRRDGGYDTNKYRYRLPPAAGTTYQNIQLSNGTLRPITVGHSSRKYSTSSEPYHQNHPNMWQEIPQFRTSNVPCLDHKPSDSTSRSKACSIGLAVVSFIILISILVIAGLALYMGISTSSATTNSSSIGAMVSFSCSIKVLKGDRLIGDALEEKKQRYKRQIEQIYRNSVIGSSFISCLIDRFGKDGNTIFFRLIFNRLKLIENSINIEKTIRDIFLNDIINSKKTTLRNVKFDPKSLLIVKQQIHKHENDKEYLLNGQKNLTSHLFTNKKAFTGTQVDRSKLLMNQTNGVQKVSKIHIQNQPKQEEELNNNGDNEREDNNLPIKAIQGSFTISKTDSDIIEKRTQAKPLHNSTFTIKKNLDSPIMTTLNISISTPVPSLLKMIISSTTTSKPIITSLSPKSTVTPQIIQSPETITTPTHSTKMFETSSTFYSFDEPWIPIIPNNNNKNIYSNSKILNQTPSIFPWLNSDQTNIHPVKKFNNNNNSENQSPPYSSLFPYEQHQTDYDKINKKEFNEEAAINEELNFGQGHVEVIEEDVEELLSQTDGNAGQISLVTLLPVRSNSGIQPKSDNNSTNRKQWKNSKDRSIFENRSFLSNKNKENNHQIVGVLNFKNDEYNITKTPTLIIK